MSSTVSCKVFRNEETQAYLSCWVSPNITLKDLRKIVERATPVKFANGSIRYLDDEGDKITIETDIELAEALKLGQKLGTLQLYLETPTTAPVDTTPASEIKVPEKVVEPEAPKQAEPSAPSATPTAPPTHRAICDACHKTIVGIRYKCVNCPDYDLCETCEEQNGYSGSIHQNDHVFLKIRRPICPFQRISLPNLYEGAHRRPHCPVTMRGHLAVNRGRCPVQATAQVTTQITPAPAQPTISEDRFAALEAKVAQLTQEMQQITAKNQKEVNEKKQREERKQAQEQKRKEVRALLQKAGEERRAIKKEQQLKKEQQREAARQAAAAALAAKKEVKAARQVAPAPVVEVKIEEQEEKKEEEVPEVVVQVEEVTEPVEVNKEEVKEEVVVKIEETPKEEEQEEEAKKEGDDFVVINDEVPPTQNQRATFFKESLEILGSMGFTNVERNLELLVRHSGDIQAVITVLLDIVEIL